MIRWLIGATIILLLINIGLRFWQWPRATRYTLPATCTLLELDNRGEDRSVLKFACHPKVQPYEVDQSFH